MAILAIEQHQSEPPVVRKKYGLGIMQLSLPDIADATCAKYQDGCQGIVTASSTSSMNQPVACSSLSVPARKRIRRLSPRRPVRSTVTWVKSGKFGPYPVKAKRPDKGLPKTDESSSS